MKSDPTDVARAIRLSRLTITNIKENLFWAFLYNLIGIPLAIGLFGLSLDPMFGAAAMSLSSFSVVMNALRLNFFKSETEKKNKLFSAERGEVKREKVIRVEGMMCPHCEARVKSALEALPYVDTATPSHKDGTVTLVLPENCDESLLYTAIEARGYKVIK